MGRGGEVASSFWESASLSDAAVPSALRRTLGEGHTPLTVSVSHPALLLKREDQNPSGSHKDRAAAYQLAAAATAGHQAVVISSSGNAGVATSRYAQLHGVHAYVCVHPDTDPAKLAAIDGDTTTLIVTPRAINTAKQLARELGVPNLRPSVHDDALIGYATLADELAPVDATDIVLFATSGATAVAVATRLAELGSAARVHFVQGEGNAQLADPQARTTDTSAQSAAAGRLGVRHSRRGKALQRAIALSAGSGHVVDALHVAQARQQLREVEGIDVSDESAANFVIAQQLAAGERAKVVCVISGAPPQGRGAAIRIDVADEQEALANLAAQGRLP